MHVTRACTASKSEPVLNGIDNVCKSNYERLRMEYEILNNEKRQQDEELTDLRIYIDRRKLWSKYIKWYSLVNSDCDMKQGLAKPCHLYSHIFPPEFAHITEIILSDLQQPCMNYSNYVLSLRK